MARGHGSVAPKPADQRRRYNQPARGEWVDLEPLEKAILPPADRKWSPRVKRLWNAWRVDPVSSQYGEADIAALWEFAAQYEQLAPNEQRLRMDGFGLTPKGKRDLRWRTPAEVATLAKPPKAEVRRLRVVASDALERP